MHPKGLPCNGMLPMCLFYAAAQSEASSAFGLTGTKASSHSSGRSHSYCPEPPGATGSLLLKWGRYFNRLFERGLIVALSQALPNKKKGRKRRNRLCYLDTGLVLGSGAELRGCLWQTIGMEQLPWHRERNRSIPLMFPIYCRAEGKAGNGVGMPA